MFTYKQSDKLHLSTIQTPQPIANWIYNLTKHVRPTFVLDPCCGQGNLLKPWFAEPAKYYCVGIDIDSDLLSASMPMHNFINKSFEHIESLIELGGRELHPNYLILCNPPYNGHWRRDSYPEIFLKKIVEIFGKDVPIVFACPMGFRLNQKRKSERWRWLRDHGPEITSIITCPIDLYKDTEFHTEILLFNIKRVKPHYFIPESVMENLCENNI
jgi:predicted RNA methylase